MLLGLIFRESAKPKRSIRACREEGRGIFDVFTSSTENDVEKGPASEFGVKRDTGSGYSFGRQGEKNAVFILQWPEETLPRYVSPTHPLLATTPMPEPASMPAPTTQSNPKRPATRPKSHSAVDSAVSAGRNPSRPPQDV
ncbi:hypothetical protein VKT23_004682 [Stygiomarasmius scandens]|uniref:Uncharacterized protein n=1 Tax=Marasmiellus scandens TaxID=2682957 RepID=A0ABR1JZA6_9AGAR